MKGLWCETLRVSLASRQCYLDLFSFTFLTVFVCWSLGRVFAKCYVLYSRPIRAQDIHTPTKVIGFVWIIQSHVNASLNETGTA